ncbi:MAG TPA: PEP-utilizing enzyme [Polyangiaceae bacterium LLY-WYZ-14_1]|jgi:pyruvate,water dikinase|nr:PEP-utilizing enzyme [Polyangiaceae bacterium LLY-WYZ-14_1]
MTREWIVDNEPSQTFPIYTRANVGEVFPDVVMPFSWTLWGIPMAEPGWQQAFVNLGAFDQDEFPAGEMTVIGVFGGYCYLNVSVSRIFGARTPGLSPEAIDLSFFGGYPDVPPYQKRDTDESPKHEAAMGKTLEAIFTADSLPELHEMREKVLKLRGERPDLSSLSNQELVDRARHIYRTMFAELWTKHIMLTYQSMIPPGAIGQICEAVGKPELATTIMAGLGNVDSAIPARQLWELSRGVRNSKALTALFDEGTDGLLDRVRRSEDPEVKRFAEDIDKLLYELGSRGPNEWEMASKTWGVAPHKPIAALDRMRHAEDADAPDARIRTLVEEKEQAVAQVSEMLKADPATQGQFQAAVRAAAVFLGGRERTKTTCALMVHEARLAMWELGRRLVESGVFQRPEQFALITDDEYDGFLADPASMKQTIADRDAQARRLSDLEPPFIIDGETIPSTSWRRRDAEEVDRAKAGDQLAGLPGCPGTAKGRARVVLDPSEPGDLQPGDILVAHSTDPSWTPLFTAVSGVVVDVGATISHATVVSRELGIPCAISVTHATRRIPNGATIEVNGTTGQVTVVDA